MTRILVKVEKFKCKKNLRDLKDELKLNKFLILLGLSEESIKSSLRRCNLRMLTNELVLIIISENKCMYHKIQSSIIP
jgi:hypothetical protein